MNTSKRNQKCIAHSHYHKITEFQINKSINISRKVVMKLARFKLTNRTLL